MYEIRVAGVVPERDLQDMGAVTAAPDQVNTILYGVRDQAALYCLLARLRALGIETIGFAVRPGSGAAAAKFPPDTCYEVALTGKCGRVYRGLQVAGVKRAVTTSDFLLPVSPSAHPRHRGDARGARTDDPAHRRSRSLSGNWKASLTRPDEAPNSIAAKSGADDSFWSGRIGNVAPHGRRTPQPASHSHGCRTYNQRRCPAGSAGSPSPA